MDISRNARAQDQTMFVRIVKGEDFLTVPILRRCFLRRALGLSKAQDD